MKQTAEAWNQEFVPKVLFLSRLINASRGVMVEIEVFPHFSRMRISSFIVS
jgi:hypothetical protein